jgi:hypothetical protein
MKTLFFTALFAVSFTMLAFAQPRPVDKATPAAAVKPAPESFPAQYQGGMFGYSKKTDGTFRFDDTNRRIVFTAKDQPKELFSLSYDALLVIYPQSQSVTSTTGNVISHIPLPGAGFAGFIKEKRRYLVLQFDDPDVEAKGLINFRLEDKELLDSVIQSLGDKAKMVQRGDAFYRPKVLKSDI